MIMSVVSKQVFASAFKDRLYDKLTTKEADLVLSELMDQLIDFDVEQVEREDARDDFRQMLQIYLNTLQVEGRSPKTIERYQDELLRFHAFDPTPLKYITVYNIRQYLAHEKERGLCDTTLCGKRSIFHSYFGWLHREGLLLNNPCANLRTMRAKFIERQPFSDIELELLKRSCRTPKEKAIVSFLLSTGCRIGEVVALNRDDIDFQNRCVKVLGKGNKERFVYFTDVTAMYLKEYLNSRTDDNEALFLSKFNRRMNEHSHQAQFRALGERSGVDKVFPHRFRHTFATTMIRNGMPIQEVAVLLGHSRIDTTQVYAHTNQDRVHLSYLMYA